MNRKILGTLVLVGGLVISAGCYAGPKRLSRSWDDFENKAYVENAWLTGILGVLPVYPVVAFAACVGDSFYNFYYFWFRDALDNNTGTAFIHQNVGGARKSVSGPGF